MTATRQQLAANWNPRPRADYTPEQRKSYYAGYSDAYYRYPYGSGQENAQWCGEYRYAYHCHGAVDRP